MKVIKIISNQYTVLDENQNRYLAKVSGKLKRNCHVIVGDNVVAQQKEDAWMIEDILPRKNDMIRPLIANVDQAFIVMSCQDPVFSTTLIDRLCFLIVHANIQPILCVSKTDLMTPNVMEKVKLYESTIPVILLDDLKKLKEALKDKVTVLTGQSGVGKSTLLNRLNANFNIKTQATSKALGRGKHTTRHSELYLVEGGLVADTPGFSALDFSHMNATELEHSVLQFRNCVCKFRNCLHVKELGCAVKEALGKTIPHSVYKHYLEVLKIIQDRRENK